LAVPARNGIIEADMDEHESQQPPTYPPGFEPPTDVNVPWYAWVLYPLAILIALVVTAVLFRGCFGNLT